MKLIRTHKILLAVIGVVALRSAAAQMSQYTPKNTETPAQKAAKVNIQEVPSLELYRNHEAIIRWTSDNPGGSDEHWGLVTYGTDPQHLDTTVKSHIRLNRNHSYTVFRVRVPDVKPKTTYYYTISSMNGDGSKDNVTSGLYHFTTPAGE